MTILVPIVLLGCVPCVLLLFWLLSPRAAMLSALIVGWLFMPIAGYVYPLIHYNKPNALGLGLLVAVCAFHSRRLASFRPQWLDLPVVVLCLCPAISTFGNAQGAGNAGVSSVNFLLQYGVPYLMGRMYFRTLADMRHFAWAMLLGGLLYVPLCLYEVRMSPQLHAIVYGFHQHQFAQTRRYGGWRPTVFMQHGLAVAWWMCSALLAGIGVWRGSGSHQFKSLPVSLAILLVTIVLCKSIGAMFLLVVGTGILLLRQSGQSRCALL